MIKQNAIYRLIPMQADLTQSLRIDPSVLPEETVVFGSTAAMRAIRKRIDLALSSDKPVLIQGESGTGKELVARFIHTRSDRREAPFVKVNCATVPTSLLESEFFGYKKGAFTEAREDRSGLIELANKGTLFLDQIGELDANIQGKILHLLRYDSFTRIGDSEERPSRVRLICATSPDLQSAVEAGTFRGDLFRQIDGISLHLVALRDRKSDIPQLCEYFLHKFARQFGRSAPRLDVSTLRLLIEWDWPGNVRELENWIARVVILGDAAVLAAELRRRLSSSISRHGVGALTDTRRFSTSAPTGAMILRTLRANRWNRRKTAEDLNMSYRSFLYKLREVGLPHRRRSHKDFPPAAE
jgi:two-component system, NtrC family, response regulator AtoC